MRRLSIVAGVGLLMSLMAAVVPAVVFDARSGMSRLAAPARPAAVSQAPATPAPPASDARPLARRAVEMGLMELALDPDVWNRVEAGDAPDGFRLDSVYRAPDGAGTFAVALTSGPLFGQITITGVGRAESDVRAMRVVYDYFPRREPREVACSWDAGAPRCP